MSQPSGSSSNRFELSGWHYLLIFSAFALVALVLVSSKYERRQPQFEQQYRGISEMQRHPPGSGGDKGEGSPATPPKPDEPPPAPGPLIVSLRPLMIALALVMVVAWIGIKRKRWQAAAGRGKMADGG
ncbi:MAG: hypothetical protein K8T25_10885 [Planctomycetia bacterium]|nr:hypothetical protein [Planctomycetia bacterium]